MKKARAWRGAASVAAAMAGLSAASSAGATHLLAGSIQHRVPDPAGAPLTAEIEVVLAWRNAFPVTQISVVFGDGTSSDVPSAGVVGAVDFGNGYTMSRFLATHTYPSAGSYQAGFGDCCFGSNTVNGSSESMALISPVVVGSGKRGGPVAPLMPIVPVQTGGLRTFEIPVAEHDGGPVTCALNPVFPAPIIPGGAGPTVSTTATGCLVTWDTTGAVAGQLYRFTLDIGDSSAPGQRTLTFVAEMRLGPSPTCAGGGLFNLDLGVPFSTPMTGDTLPAGGALQLATWQMFGVVTPGPGTTSAAPFTTEYALTPGPGDEGAHASTIVFSDPQGRAGLCPIATYVAPCAVFGDPCSAGTGACQSPGYKSCSGGQVLCSAVPGAPQAETCNGADDDCDGTPDNAPQDVGLPCATGLPGVCSTGHTECAAGVLLCPPAIPPGSLPETCDGEDEDCDGLVDEDFGAGMACTAGVGACQSEGVLTCTSPDSALCDAVPGVPSAEICDNGVDEDCDGVADDGCPMGGVGGGAGVGGAGGAGAGGAGGQGGSGVGGQGGSGVGGAGNGGSGGAGASGGQGGSGQGGSGQGGSGQGGSGQGGSDQGGSDQGGSGAGAGAGGGSGPGGSGSGAGDAAGSGAGAGGGDEDLAVGGCACRSAGAPASSELPWWLVAACLLPAARLRRRRRWIERRSDRPPRAVRRSLPRVNAGT